MIGRTIAHYKIAEKLCGGGMGVRLVFEGIESFRLSEEGLLGYPDSAGI